MSRSRLFPPPKRDLSVEQREPLDATTRSVAFFSPSRPCFSPLSLAPTPLQIPLLTRLKPPVVGWLKGHPPRASSSSSLRAARRRAPSQPFFRAQSHHILFFSLMSGDSSPRRLAFASRKRNGHSIAPTLARYRWRSPALHSIRPPARLEAPFFPPGIPGHSFPLSLASKAVHCISLSPGGASPKRSRLAIRCATWRQPRFAMARWRHTRSAVHALSEPFTVVRNRSTTRDEPLVLALARPLALASLKKNGHSFNRPFDVSSLLSQSAHSLRAIARLERNTRFFSPDTRCNAFVRCSPGTRTRPALDAMHSPSHVTMATRSLARPGARSRAHSPSPSSQCTRSLALTRLVTMHSFAIAHSGLTQLVPQITPQPLPDMPHKRPRIRHEQRRRDGQKRAVKVETSARAVFR